jgi:hypothetical protein
MRLGWDTKKTEAEANRGVPGLVLITRKGRYVVHNKINQVKFMCGGVARFVRKTRAMAVCTKKRIIVFPRTDIHTGISSLVSDRHLFRCLRSNGGGG